jgi:dUTP pyrophosphatase
MNIKVFRIRDEAKLPVRAHNTDAGMDLFYCPDFSKPANCSFNENGLLAIAPGASSLIPTGVKVEVPLEHMLEVKNKSGIATRQQLLVGACVIDAGYNGEVYVNLHNISAETRVVEPGQKIAQAVLTPIICCGIEEVHSESGINYNSSRGTGGFGSTGLL